jgi:hypothetical protein
MEGRMSVEFDTRIKLAVYRAFADTGCAPGVAAIAAVTGAGNAEVLAAYARLRAQRLLVLAADGATIRMAPPFSGVPTQHRVHVGGVEYVANCAWDALGVIAALGKPGVVHSRCEQSREPLALKVDRAGPERSDWRFHCLVPAAHWWDDIVFT